MTSRIAIRLDFGRLAAKSSHPATSVLWSSARRNHLQLLATAEPFKWRVRGRRYFGATAARFGCSAPYVTRHGHSARPRRHRSTRGCRQSKADRIFILSEVLERMRASFFRQTMFAEFELQAHDARQRGEALSGQRFSEMYCGLLRKSTAPTLA